MKNYGTQNMVTKLKKVLMKKPQKFMSDVDKKKWNYDSTLDQNLINKNYDDFYQIIKKFGVEIFELKLDDEKEELCDSIFTHDPSLVINEGAIILNMGKKLRKKEILFHKNFYESHNIPIVGQIINTGSVEGGDCLWINEKTLLVGESLRTNISGINQLTVILNKYNINLIPIKLPTFENSKNCFHLMSMISMLDNDLAIGCLSLMPKNLIEILNIYKIKLLNIPKDEYFLSKTLAVNILTLSPRTLIMLNGYQKTFDLLIKENCKINTFEGSELCIKSEGGPTCLTRPLLRD